jgi:L-ascorbate metabolism protein UlaG (beta-lactamase superfamily)
MSLGGATQITWLGHASFRFTLPGGEVLLLDPWLRDNPQCPQGLRQPERVDAILVTHGHDDHFGDVVPLAREHGARVVAIHEIATLLADHRQLPPDQLLPMNIGGTVTPLAGVDATMVRADHSSTIREENGSLVPAGVAAGFVLRIDGLPAIYAAGDTAAFGDMVLIGELEQPDVAILPIGGVYTMGPGAAAWAAKMLGVRAVLPCHYGTFPALTGSPADLREALGGAAEVIELKPGQEVP